MIYNTFLQKYQEARITTSSKIGDANIMVVSPAIVPDKPLAPKKALNVAIAMVLGLMVGVFTVFFLDYMAFYLVSDFARTKKDIKIILWAMV